MEKNKILVVDDDEKMRDLTGEILGEIFPEKEIISTENGLKAWEVIQKNFNHLFLVITDWEIPDKNGVELTKMIKATFPEIPVVLMSGNPAPAENPADGFLGKPFYIGDLVTLVFNVSQEAP
ncbi:MAG: hypothetical protein A3I88_01290 [Candidatus Portnoybacteria bacterium RIFCSPLOWO2_12_FULL_39_9]|uniref:Response regulatory domain-containing protein n=1 Tax=Candidatus Portnoybacteria bacterium RIFCSPHIGHO2_12_FULL_38_9 TaxID=1801997 RepID=A0A1G2FHF6_9BACT|nr:MAG: hypothetical protein A3H00_01645 [Candidatus Portnoybacteria bacterium RBG_13_40_8]OGZ36615.1 MAG: hypothetical protein A2646_00350 [Candidatus Portnoybacteria bacterium RIFCSPHIGHO2_02_FULL_39_12]OGZ37509.1 MAG: hypothetical protein A3J64_00775 [Candidatus Portnoybacteria bacterium RIFCSPHIGHO2_12_FULL_38_9]OGZ39371.1 MAG: hypothetical protein A3F21_02815 [Candidatus Portnoybacteria bacterium RIFCSPLOWO2_01_FULL_38_39]OGZ39849.1 MAG: hypothetical protein A3I88_01290 [Candidatus Portnoy